MIRPVESPGVKSAVPPQVAGILSLIIPGFGQIITGFWQRGVLIFLSMISMLGIMQWRITELGRRAGNGWPAFVHALERRPFFVIVMLLCIAAIWILLEEISI